MAVGKEWSGCAPWRRSGKAFILLSFIAGRVPPNRDVLEPRADVENDLCPKTQPFPKRLDHSGRISVAWYIEGEWLRRD